MKWHKSKPVRRGLVSVAMLIGLMIVVLVIGILTRSALMQRSEAAKSERRLQAEALAESGIERAVARLAAASSYRGEVWELQAADLGRRDDASVLIQVEPVQGQTDRHRIEVKADYPKSPERRTRVTRIAFVDLSSIQRPEKGAK